MVYLIEKYKKENKLLQIAKLEEKDPGKFWNQIRKLTKKQTQKSNIHHSAWQEYFKDLLNTRSNNADTSFHSYVQNTLPVLENINNNSTEIAKLNAEISIKEVADTIKTLKNNKAAGHDRIRNEMLKCAGTTYYKLLQGIYNKILHNNEYPQAWKKSIISTIHKSGDLNTPTNYRGIAVGSCLHKVFTKIINNRIIKHMTEKDMWTPFQNGFMEGKRTEDNILTLHSAFHKYVRCEKKTRRGLALCLTRWKTMTT